MLAHAAVKLKTITPQISASLAPRLATVLRETCDRLLPGGVLLKQLIAQEMRIPALPAIADNDRNDFSCFGVDIINRSFHAHILVQLVIPVMRPAQLIVFRCV